MKGELTPAQIKKMQKQEQQRIEREQRIQQKKEEQQKIIEQYLPSLMATLERVFKTDYNAELKVENGFFELNTRDEDQHGKFVRLTPCYCIESYDTLDELNDICDRIDRQREQERLDEQARQVALSKLTTEEMKLLGIRHTKIKL